MIRNMEAFVYSICNKMVWGVTKEDWEDLYQEAMTAAFIAQKSFDPSIGSTMETHVATRVRWAIIGFLRKERHHHLDYGKNTDDMPEQTERTLESRLTQKTLTLQMKTMLYALNKRQRAAVKYYYFKGLTTREIAKRMHVSVATAWRLVRGGVEELQEAYAEYHPMGVDWKC